MQRAHASELHTYLEREPKQELMQELMRELMQDGGN
jgi:hypothetical protein